MTKGEKEYQYSRTKIDGQQLKCQKCVMNSERLVNTSEVKTVKKNGKGGRNRVNRIVNTKSNEVEVKQAEMRIKIK